MRPALSVLLAAALLAGCGQPLLSAELEVPEIRITSEPKDFPATTLALPADFCAGVAGCLFTDVEYDLGSEVPLLDEGDAVSVDLRLTDVAFDIASTSVPGLDGLRCVRVLLDPGGAAIVAASWVRPAGPTPAEIRVAGNSNIDLGPYLADGKITARIEVDYDTTFPMGAFTANIVAGFSLVATVEYLSLM
jgi:hypothetical protein